MRPAQAWTATDVPWLSDRIGRSTPSDAIPQPVKTGHSRQLQTLKSFSHPLLSHAQRRRPPSARSRATGRSSAAAVAVAATERSGTCASWRAHVMAPTTAGTHSRLCACVRGRAGADGAVKTGGAHTWDLESSDPVACGGGLRVARMEERHWPRR